MNYPELIKELRNKLLISQTELAEMLGTNKITISRWENGWFEPTYKYKRQLIILFREYLSKEVNEDV